jgi:hypothetical protein
MPDAGSGDVVQPKALAASCSAWVGWMSRPGRPAPPRAPQPELTVFELRDGGYAPVAKASGPFAADRPFTMSIDLADLTRGLRR